MEETTERCAINARVPSYTLDQIFKWVAWRLPRRLVYWCAIRLMVNGGVDDSAHVLPELRCIDALKRWNIKEGHDQSRSRLNKGSGLATI